MSQRYDVKFNGKDFRIEVDRLDRGGVLIVRVGTETFTLKASKNEDGTWSVNDTSEDYAVKFVRKTGKNVTIELNGEPLELEWDRVRREETVVQSTTTAGAVPRVQGGVYPPMPGKITEVHVKVADKVESGQTVCILEAMKMFNELKAPLDGHVKEVNIEAGSTVTPDDLLVLVE